MTQPTEGSEPQQTLTPEQRAQRLVARLREAGISNEEVNAKAEELGGMEAAANFYEQFLNTRDRESAFAAFGGRPPSPEAASRPTAERSISRLGDKKRLEEERDRGTISGEGRRELERIEEELGVVMETEGERDAYRTERDRIFTRIKEQERRVLESIRASDSIRLNREELLNRFNDLSGAIQALREKEVKTAEERQELDRRADALDIVLEEARAEVIRAIEAFNPLEIIKLRALQDLENPVEIPANSDRIRRFAELDPDTRERFSREIDRFKREYEALRRMHNFAVSAKGKGAREISEALPALSHEALVDVLAGPEGEAIRKMVLERYKQDGEIFRAINQAPELRPEEEVRARLKNETILGNEGRVFKDDDLQAQYVALSSDEQGDFEEAHSDNWTAGFEFKQQMKEQFVKTSLAEEFTDNPEYRLRFAEINGLEIDDSDRAKKEALTEKIKGSNEYLTRKITLEQRMAVARDFYETTVAPVVIVPVKVAPKEGDERKYFNGRNYIFAGNYKDNPLVKDRFPQWMIEAGGNKVNFENQVIFEQIFLQEGIYKYKDPAEKLMALFGVESLEELKDMPDLEEKIRRNPNFVTNLRDDVYKDAAAVEANEMYDKLEKFELNPTEEAAKALMDSYFGKSPDDRREFNKRVLTALMRHKMTVNGVINVSGKDTSQYEKWGPRRVEDYLIKQMPVYIGPREKDEILNHLYKGKLLSKLGIGGKARMRLFSKPAEMTGAFVKEIKPLNLFTSLFREIFRASKDQINSDLR